MERKVNYDLMRVISMIFVIMIHVPSKPLAGHVIFSKMLITVLFLCNSLFFMISGRFNLSHSFEQKNDYVVYYKKKSIAILLPYIIVTIILCVWNMCTNGIRTNANGMIYMLYTDFMSTNSSIHLWFMYSLLGMLISAPFLAILLNLLIISPIQKMLRKFMKLV